MHHFFIFAFLGILYSAIFPNKLKASDLFEKKKGSLLQEIVFRYLPPSSDIGDPEKYYWPKTIARLELFGQNDSLANAWIAQFSNRSPFHFTLVGMCRILGRYPDAPQVKANRKTILQKVFDRKDSYNCWTAEGTENHINMSRTSGYLYAQEALKLGFKKAESQKRLQEMKIWILDWSKNIYQKGTGEWNSSIYGVYNLIGWLNLYDFAEDNEVKAAAKAVCDYYAAEMALNYSWGVMGGAEMRGNGILANMGSSSPYLSWFWFSESEALNSDLGKEYIQSVHAATSAYKPEEAMIQLAQKKMEKPFETRIQMPDYLITQLGFCQNQLFASNHYTLGSMASPYGGWTGSTSQIVAWKLVARPEKIQDLPFQMSGNGRYYQENSGKTRDPFTQIIQKGRVLFQLTCLPKNIQEIESQINGLVKKWSQNWQSDFAKRFPEESEKPNVVKPIKGKIRKSGSYLVYDERAKVWLDGGIMFLEMNGTYVAIRSICQEYPNALKQKEKPGFDWVADQCAMGSLSGFVIETGDFGSHGSFDKFKAAMKKSSLQKPGSDSPYSLVYQSSLGEKLEAEFQPSGTFQEAIVDWGYGVKQPQTHINTAPFVQPKWPEGLGHGKMGKLNGMNLQVEGGVFSGTVMELERGILKIKIQGKVFESAVLNP
jgi:hypothetical protein